MSRPMDEPAGGTKADREAEEAAAWIVVSLLAAPASTDTAATTARTRSAWTLSAFPVRPPAAGPSGWRGAHRYSI